jgi:hypothetical protein
MRLISAAYAIQDMEKGVAESGTGFSESVPACRAARGLTIKV